MNIFKEIFKTNNKKRRYNLINQLNIEKKDKIEVAKAIDNGEFEGNGDEVKEWYYAIDVEKITQDLGINTNDHRIVVFDGLKSFCNPIAYLVTAGYGDNYDISERTIVDGSESFFFKRLIAIKLSNALGTEVATGSSQTFKIVRYYGNLEERTKIFKDFNIIPLIDFTQYMTEISKEQYYNDIKIPIVDINKD